ncbi:MAG: hypothetical protein MUF73_13365 [Rhodobacteraceae bacterium]|nr:hypothetical protein [Paracoccaceae bacterium]
MATCAAARAIVPNSPIMAVPTAMAPVSAMYIRPMGAPALPAARTSVQDRGRGRRRRRADRARRHHASAARNASASAAKVPMPAPVTPRPAQCTSAQVRGTFSTTDSPAKAKASHARSIASSAVLNTVSIA